ncbi:MAG: DUF167 domain-containing protein [Chloroflexi bacterium]|nr:DUF167 domain-containing protein [Chloroflexota bacterium]
MFKEEPVTITVRVQPNARQNKVTGFKDGVWQLTIAAPPVKGKANQGLIKFLSDILGVAKSNLAIEKGMASKRKTIAVNGLTRSQAMKQLGSQVL